MFTTSDPATLILGCCKTIQVWYGYKDKPSTFPNWTYLCNGYGNSSACMSVYQMQVCSPWRSEEGVGFPGTGLTDSCTEPGGCWELNLGLLREQQGLLTTERSLQPHIYAFKSKKYFKHTGIYTEQEILNYYHSFVKS